MTYQDIMDVNKGLKTIDIHGKPYIEVAQRVKAFRQLIPNGCISTEVLNCENGIILARAEVRDGEGKLLSTGLAYEKETSSQINRNSFVENAETSAVGRALGFLGIGIDTSIASYEEVAQAIAQQRISEQTYVILSELINHDMEEKIITRHHISSLRELDEETAQKYIKQIKERKTK